jgi:hypothetical protein
MGTKLNSVAFRVTINGDDLNNIGSEASRCFRYKKRISERKNIQQELEH